MIAMFLTVAVIPTRAEGDGEAAEAPSVANQIKSLFSFGSQEDEPAETDAPEEHDKEKAFQAAQMKMTPY